MSDSFVKEWGKERAKPISAKLGDMVNREPLRERVSQTVYKLSMVKKRLEDSEARLKVKDKELFKKCVEAYQAKNGPVATMYANETAQLRKMVQTVVGCQIAIEQVTLRLETVRDFGDIATIVVPAAGIIRSIKDRVVGIMPEVSHTMEEISGSLDGLTMEVGQASGAAWGYHALGEDSEKILAEAGLVAEQRMKEGFPTLPSSINIGEGLPSADKY